MVDFGTKVLGTQNATIKLMFLILKKIYQILERLVFCMKLKCYLEHGLN